MFTQGRIFSRKFLRYYLFARARRATLREKSNILIRSATPMKERRRDTNSYHAANKSGLRLLPESILSRINDKIYETPKVGQHPLLPRSRESPLREDKAR